MKRWAELRALRDQLTEAIEPYRRDKTIRSSLEANVVAVVYSPTSRHLLDSVDFSEIGIVSRCKAMTGEGDSVSLETMSRTHGHHLVHFEIARTDDHKCGRCWRHLPEVESDGALCRRCTDVLDA